MSWNVTLQSSLVMPMQKYTSVKMNGVQGPCPTSGFYFRFAILVFGHSSFGDLIIFFPFCRAYGSGKEDNPMCDVPGFENSKMKLLRHVSFVDCPVRSRTIICCLGLIFMHNY
jgi:hypothetical protein